MKHITEIKVRGYHLDGYLHVNNARYLEFMEEARWQYLDQINALAFFESRNLAFVISNITIDYKFPGLNGDVVVIETIPAKKGPASWLFHQTGSLKSRPDKIIFKAGVTFVLLDKSSGKPVRVTKEMEEHLLPTAH